MRAPSEPDPSLGAAIRRLRKGRDETQEDLARLAVLHVTTLARIERAEVDISWTTLRRVARALDVPPSALVLLAEEIGTK